MWQSSYLVPRRLHHPCRLPHRPLAAGGGSYNPVFFVETDPQLPPPPQEGHLVPGQGDNLEFNNF